MTEPLSAQGRDLLDDDRALDAVDVLRRAVAAGEPSAPDLLVRAYLDSGSWHAAVEWLGPLVAQGRVEFAGRLGVAYAEIGDAENAETALRTALDHGELAAANDLAILLRDADRVAEAVHVLARAAEEGDPQAPANLIEVLLEDGDLRGAAEAAERFADDARPDTLVALADVRAAESRFDEAERVYRRAEELGGVRAHTAYGQFLLAVRGIRGRPRRSSGRPSGTTSPDGRGRSGGSWSTTGARTRRGSTWRSPRAGATGPRWSCCRSWTGSTPTTSELPRQPRDARPPSTRSGDTACCST